MAKWTLIALALLVVVCAATSAGAGKVSVAVGYGGYFPSSSATRDTFGSTWPQISFGNCEPGKTDKWYFMGDFSAYRVDDPAEARLYPLTFGAERALSDDLRAQPYVALRAGPYYGKVKVPATGVSAHELGFNANAAVGVVFQRVFFVEARYDFFSGMAGFDFHGASLKGGVRLFDIKY